MNPETIKEFLVGLGFDVDEAGLAKFQSTMGGLAVGAAAVTTAILAAGGALLHFVAGQAEAIDTVADLGERTDTTTAEIMELGYVAGQTDSNLAAVTSTVEGLSKAMGEADLGLGRGAMAFKKLGLEPRKANGVMKTTSEMLDEIGKKVAGLDKKVQGATLSKLGIDPSLVKALTTDTSALREDFRATYEALGVDLNAAGEEAGLFNESMDRMRFTTDAVYKAVAIRLMPQLRKGVDTLRRAIQANLPLIMSVVTPIADMILRAAEAIVSLGGRILGWVGTAVGWFARLNKATDGWAGYILAAAAAWKYLNLSFLATPLGMLLSLGAAVLLLVDDFQTWKEGGESLIDWGSGFAATLVTVIGWLGTLGGAVLDAVTTMVQAAMLAWTNWDQVWAGYRMFFAWIVQQFSDLGATIASWASAAAEAVLAPWRAVWEWFTDFFAFITGGLGKVGEFVGSVAGTVGDFFGSGGGQLAPAGHAGLTPAPAAAAALGGMSQDVSQKTEINVYGATDPVSTGRQVANQQGKVNGDMVRNMRGVAR